MPVVIPALKDRAKLKPPLRGEDYEVGRFVEGTIRVRSSFIKKEKRK